MHGKACAVWLSHNLWNWTGSWSRANAISCLTIIVVVAYRNLDLRPSCDKGDCLLFGVLLLSLCSCGNHSFTFIVSI